MRDRAWGVELPWPPTGEPAGPHTVGIPAMSASAWLVLRVLLAVAVAALTVKGLAHA